MRAMPFDNGKVCVCAYVCMCVLESAAHIQRNEPHRESEREEKHRNTKSVRVRTRNNAMERLPEARHAVRHAHFGRQSSLHLYAAHEREEREKGREGERGETQ